MMILKTEFQILISARSAWDLEKYDENSIISFLFFKIFPLVNYEGIKSRKRTC